MLALQQLARWVCPHPSPFLPTNHKLRHSEISTKNASKMKTQPVFGIQCGARRRVMYDDQDYQHNVNNNAEIAMLESYTQSVLDEVLFVTATVDHIDLQLLIFKGFSSCLSLKTPSDPSISVIPATAVIKSIDRIRGPFDPSNIHYIEKGLTFHEFKSRLR